MSTTPETGDADAVEPTATGSEAPRRSTTRRILGFVREVLIVLIVGLVISALIKTFVVQAFRIPSQSMENTLQRSDRVMVLKFGEAKRGDIVVFEDELSWLPPAAPPDTPTLVLEFLGVLPRSDSQFLIKRVIGLPGDTVECCGQSGRLMINGVEIDESAYLFRDAGGVAVNPSDMQFKVTVPAGRMFVMGDHRNASADSRAHLCQQGGTKAFPQLSSVQGPAGLILLPFERFTTFSTPSAFAAIPAPTAPAPDVGVVQAGC